MQITRRGAIAFHIVPQQTGLESQLLTDSATAVQSPVKGPGQAGKQGAGKETEKDVEEGRTTPGLPEDPSAEDSMIPFYSTDQALDDLRRASADVLGRMRLRELAATEGAFNLSEWTEEEVLLYVARRMADGRFSLIRRFHVPGGGLGAADTEAKGASAAAPPPQQAASPAPSRAATAEKPTDPNTFPPNLLADQQAAALIAAAKTGVPFCEECAKAARK